MKQEFKTPLDLICFLQIGGLLFNERLSNYPYTIRNNNIVDVVTGEVLHFSHLCIVDDWKEYIISPRVCWVCDDNSYPNKEDYTSIYVVEFYMEDKEWNFRTLCKDIYSVWKYATPLDDEELRMLGLKYI